MRHALPFLLLTALAAGQSPAPPRPAILEIEIDKIQFYWRDSADFTQFATVPERVTGSLPRNFLSAEGLGDIVAVNGTPVKGTMTAQISGIVHNPDAATTPGQAIADTRATGRLVYEFDIWSMDGQQIGTIYATGLNNTPLPPGAPPSAQSLNLVVVGGTGAFLGARGQMQHSGLNQQAAYPASIREDPGRRRSLSTGRGFSFNRVAHLIPWKTPEIDAVLHQDFTPVTAANPAKAGEVLILRAKGLGPTRPNTTYGQPFPSDPRADVISPVIATFDGQKVAALNAFGWPGEVDVYRIDITVPDGIPLGKARLGLEVAWIPGSEISVPTR